MSKTLTVTNPGSCGVTTSQGSSLSSASATTATVDGGSFEERVMTISSKIGKADSSIDGIALGIDQPTGSLIAFDQVGDDSIRQFDAHVAALGAILNEWTSEQTYDKRVANLRGTSTGLSSALRRHEDIPLRAGDSLEVATVFDDSDEDVLTGSAGLDWFFFDLSDDHATDLKDEVFADDLICRRSVKTSGKPNPNSLENRR